MDTNTNNIVARGYMAVEDGDWDAADNFFEQVLNINPYCGDAYWGKLKNLTKALYLYNVAANDYYNKYAMPQ